MRKTYLQYFCAFFKNEGKKYDKKAKLFFLLTVKKFFLVMNRDAESRA